MQKVLFTKKQLALLIIPLVLEQVLTAIIGAVDTIMVSSAGEAVISGVSLTNSVNMTFITVFSALGAGGTIVVSQYIGRQDRESAEKSGLQVFMLTLMISLLLGLVCMAAGRPILSFVFGSVDYDVMESAAIYFLITAASYPAAAQFSTCSALFRATGDSTMPLVVAILMNLINIVFNAVFIYVFHMGAAGVAFATLISRFAAAIYMTVRIMHTASPLRIKGIAHYRPDIKMCRSILSVGIPAGIENAMFNIGKVAVSSIISTLGTSSIATYAVTGDIISIVVTAGTGVGIALMTVTGQYVGAGDSESAAKYIKIFTRIAAVLVITLQLLVVLFRGIIVSFYGYTPETAEFTYDILLYSSIGIILFWSTSFIVPYGLKAAGDAKFTLVVAVVSMWVIRVCVGYLLAVQMKLDLYGIYAAMWIEWIIRSIFYGARLRSGKWLQHKVID